MKRINLRGLSEVLNEKELKNVLGGSSANDCSSGYCYTSTRNCYYGSKAEENAKNSLSPGDTYTCNNYYALTKCCFN